MNALSVVAICAAELVSLEAVAVAIDVAWACNAGLRSRFESTLSPQSSGAPGWVAPSSSSQSSPPKVGFMWPSPSRSAVAQSTSAPLQS